MSPRTHGDVATRSVWMNSCPHGRTIVRVGGWRVGTNGELAAHRFGTGCDWCLSREQVTAAGQAPPHRAVEPVPQVNLSHLCRTGVL